MSDGKSVSGRTDGGERFPSLDAQNQNGSSGVSNRISVSNSRSDSPTHNVDIQLNSGLVGAAANFAVSRIRTDSADFHHRMLSTSRKVLM